MGFAFRAAFLTVLVASVGTRSPAQTVPNLRGTWVLQLDKSDFGGAPVPQSRTDVIDHQEPKLTIKRTVVSAVTGETVTNLVYEVDGKPYKNMVGPTELTSTLKWEDQTLVIVSTASSPQGDITFTDRISLSADGKTLTQLRTISIQGQEINQTIVLAKQP